MCIWCLFKNQTSFKSLKQASRTWRCYDSHHLCSAVLLVQIPVKFMDASRVWCQQKEQNIFLNDHLLGTGSVCIWWFFVTYWKDLLETAFPGQYKYYWTSKCTLYPSALVFPSSFERLNIWHRKITPMWGKIIYKKINC